MCECRVEIVRVVALPKVALVALQEVGAKLSRSVKDTQSAIHQLPSVEGLFKERRTKMAIPALTSRSNSTKAVKKSFPAFWMVILIALPMRFNSSERVYLIEM
jgi:hypothetical protein